MVAAAGVSSAQVKWVAPEPSGKLPKNAIRAGREAGKALYLCRAKLSDGLHPGKTDGTVCVVGQKGKPEDVRQFEIATGRHVKWSRGDWSTALAGGLQFGTMELYVCRARVEGDVVPGKAYGHGPHQNHCFVPYHDRELDFDGNFELLHVSVQ